MVVHSYERNSIRVSKITTLQVADLSDKLEELRIPFTAMVVNAFNPDPRWGEPEHNFRCSLSIVRLTDDQTITVRQLLDKAGVEYLLQLNSVENKQPDV